MQKITSIGGLRNKIRLLKDEQARQEQGLKEQFALTLKSLKPVNLVRSMFKSVVSSPYFIDNIVGLGIGVATGYLSKKLVTGASRYILRKFFGTILRAGVTRVITHHPRDIRSPRQPVFKNIFLKKDVNSI